MSKPFASGTTVAASKTQGEIMGLLGGRGVTKIATMNDVGLFALAFEYNGVPYRITMPLPDSSDERFNYYRKGSSLIERAESAKIDLFEAELNRRWRAFGNVIKFKIVAVEEGISTMEAEFIGNVVLPGGRTVAETHAQNLPALASSGVLPQLALPGGGR